MRLPVCLAAAIMSLAPAARAEPGLFADFAISSMLIDRGEQLGRATFEAAAGVEIPLGEATAYGALYRITPFGGDEGAFDEEVDYTLGLAWGGAGYSADLSANWLTFPGTEGGESLELAGEIVIERAFSPTLAGFYDADFEDWGLEATAGPEWTAGDWTVYTIARLGFVEPGDGSPTRTYGGFEAGAARPVGEFAELGGYLRAEAADEDAFVDQIANDEVTGLTDTGIAAGITLSFAR